MDTAAGWAPCEFQMANWNVEDEPAASFPEEYASIDIPHTWGLQPYVPESSGGQQLIEHYYYSAASQKDIPPSDKQGRTHTVIDGRKNGVTDENSTEAVDLENGGNKTWSGVVKQVVLGDFKAHIDFMEERMHRYPASLRDVDKCYTEPRIVAIGPYHRNLEHLKPAEMVKHVAAWHCISKGHTLEELYEAVVSTADYVRHLYDKEVMAGITYQDFRDMMFVDACFLVQYMFWYTDDDDEIVDPSLSSFFYSNKEGIDHDVWLLENQLPWRVVESVMRFREVPLEEFVSRWADGDFLHDRKVIKEKRFVWDYSYEPPHLLGLIRYYIVGRRTRNNTEPDDKIEAISISISAIELAEIGISLRPDATTELINMGLKKKPIVFAELSLLPLTLDSKRASYLVNMAALELCMTPSFNDAEPEDSAFCSYLLLLSMLVHREEDVHELRTKGILEGGAGLTNKDALKFFTRLQSLPQGLCYVNTMIEIENYRAKDRPIRTKATAFIYKRKKTIVAVLSTIVAVVSIFGTLIGILVKLKSFKAAP